MIKGIERETGPCRAIDTHGARPPRKSHAMSVEVATYLLSGKSRYRERNDTATVLQISRSKDPRPRDGHKAVEQARVNCSSCS